MHTRLFRDQLHGEKTRLLFIGLNAKNIFPEEYSGKKLQSKAFYEASTVKDFSIRGKACYLKVRRLRWTVKGTGEVVSRKWELVAKKTRMTREFAAFFKVLH